jgi:hypothetical protein
MNEEVIVEKKRKFYSSEPNTLCFKAYCSLISQAFKAFSDCPLIAHSSPHQRAARGDIATP